MFSTNYRRQNYHDVPFDHRRALLGEPGPLTPSRHAMVVALSRPHGPLLLFAIPTRPLGVQPRSSVSPRLPSYRRQLLIGQCEIDIFSENSFDMNVAIGPFHRRPVSVRTRLRLITSPRDLLYLLSERARGICAAAAPRRRRNRRVTDWPR